MVASDVSVALSVLSFKSACLSIPQEEVEAARAAAAPGWTGDIAWDEAVTVAMAEPPRGEETQSDREARVLKSVLEADIVPENKLGKVCRSGVTSLC